MAAEPAVQLNHVDLLGGLAGATESGDLPDAAQRRLHPLDRSIDPIALSSRLSLDLTGTGNDKQWWRELNLGSPEAIIKVFVAKSGCLSMVNRGGAMRSRAMERAMAEQGELQKGSNMGKGQVKAADYFLQPDIVTANQNSGGSGVGAAAGALASAW